MRVWAGGQHGACNMLRMGWFSLGRTEKGASFHEAPAFCLCCALRQPEVQGRTVKTGSSRRVLFPQREELSNLGCT